MSPMYMYLLVVVSFGIWKLLIEGRTSTLHFTFIVFVIGSYIVTKFAPVLFEPQLRP